MNLLVGSSVFGAAGATNVAASNRATNTIPIPAAIRSQRESSMMHLPLTSTGPSCAPPRAGARTRLGSRGGFDHLPLRAAGRQFRVRHRSQHQGGAAPLVQGQALVDPDRAEQRAE